MRFDNNHNTRVRSDKMADLDWAKEAEKLDKPIDQMKVVSDSQPGADKNESPAEVSLLNRVVRAKLIETKSDIEIQRADPSSPLYSVKSFEDLRLLVLIPFSIWTLLNYFSIMLFLVKRDSVVE